jgi:heat shock protein HslJ
MKNLIMMAVIVSLGAVAAKADGISLAGSEWGFGDGDKRFIQFGADGRVSGNAGCNRFGGNYSEDGGKLSFGPLAMTRMMCPPPDMERERAFTEILANSSRFEATHLKLTLYSASGKALATLQRRDFD